MADDSGTMQAFGMDGTYERTFDFPFVLFSLTPRGTLLTEDGTGIAEYDQNGTLLRHVDLTVDGSMLTQPIEDAAGDIWVGSQDDNGATGLLELAPDGMVLGRWSTGYETAALAPDGSAIYEAWTAGSNHGWPDLRAYALPKS